jgi:CRP/FNR family cyclic AMP-dependent transcriptional regulator
MVAMELDKSIVDALLRDPWFGEVPKPRRDLLLAQARPVEVEAGGRIYRIGDKPDGLYGVVRGEVRLISYPAVGRQVVSLRLQPGGWFGELSVLDRGPRPHDAIAHTATRLLFISLDRFEAAARQEVSLIRDLARLAGAHQRYAIHYAEQMAFQRLDVRLARQLLGALGAPTPARAEAGPELLPATQEVLATMVGASRQAVNRKLKGFEAQGLVKLHYGRVSILDAAGLEKKAFALDEN